MICSCSCQSRGKTTSKTSTLKAVTQAQLLCNLTPSGVWAFWDLLAVLWPQQNTMGMLWCHVCGWAVMSSGCICYHTAEFQQMGSSSHTHARKVTGTNVHGASDGRSAAGSTAQSTAPCSERFSTGLLNVKSYSLSSWLTFNLSFQRGFGTSRLEGNAFC